MRVIFLILFGAIACTPTGESCSTAGDTRCNSNVAEECTNGAWSVKEDCETDGLMCMTEMDGNPVDAHCMDAVDTDTDMEM